MTCADLATAIDAGLGLRSAVVLSHVFLQRLGGSALWGLPSREFLRLVEVVREVFGLRVSDFPTGRQTCLSLIPIVSSARVFTLEKEGKLNVNKRPLSTVK